MIWNKMRILTDYKYCKGDICGYIRLKMTENQLCVREHTEKNNPYTV